MFWNQTAVKHFETAIMTAKTDLGSIRGLLLHMIAYYGWTDVLEITI